jgi:hypothetical protein
VAKVIGIDALAEPSNPALVPVASPDKENVRAVANAVAVLELPVSAAVMVPAVKFPLESRATTVDEVFAEVALEVTVKVELPDWLAVKLADPDRPTPETARVSVPLFTVGKSASVARVPEVGNVTLVVPVLVNVTELAPANPREAPAAPKFVIVLELLSNPFLAINFD